MMNFVQFLAKNACPGIIGSTGIPAKIAYVVTMVVRIIQIAVPVLLIIWGMLDLGKAVMAQKEDEIKKGQTTFIKRLIAAILVFFVITIVKLMVGLFAPSKDDAGEGASEGSISSCINQLLNCKSSENCDKEK